MAALNRVRDGVGFYYFIVQAFGRGREEMIIITLAPTAVIKLLSRTNREYYTIELT